MKESLLKSFVQHPSKDEIIAKLTLSIDVKEINQWLKSKYGDIDKSLVLSPTKLSQFKEEYLDLYGQIQRDALVVSQTDNLQKEVGALVQNNSAYRQKLEEYLDQEIDIKKIVKNLVVCIEARAMQLFDSIQLNPAGTKMDYVLIQYMNTLVSVIEKYDTIINGSPDKIVQQNNINIQILDQHVGVFHKVIREVISRLDYDTSLLFVDILNEELQKIKPTNIETMSVDVRLTEAKKLEDQLHQLDIPTT